MNLLHLAPDIQEELLFLPLIELGRDTLLEGHLRPLIGRAGLAKAEKDVERTGPASARIIDMSYTITYDFHKCIQLCR